MKTKYFGDEGLSVIFTVSTKKKVPLISHTLSCYMQLDWQPLSPSSIYLSHFIFLNSKHWWIHKCSDCSDVMPAIDQPIVLWVDIETNRESLYQPPCPYSMNCFIIHFMFTCLPYGEPAVWMLKHRSHGEGVAAGLRVCVSGRVFSHIGPNELNVKNLQLHHIWQFSSLSFL